MDDVLLWKALARILGVMNGADCVWTLDGSANLRVHGMDVPVRDVDITTDDVGIAVFRERMAGHVVKDCFSEKIGGHSLICALDGVEVEMNSYDDRALQPLDSITMLSWCGLVVPTISLSHAQRFYAAIGRTEKAESIRRFVHKSRRT